MKKKKLPELKNGSWNLKDLHQGTAGIPKNGLNVFSTFSCGGGSSMGYKLAGFNVLGCVEIDPVMMESYKANLLPKHPFLMPIQEFNKLPNESLPAELFNVDVLDGSPPCSVFSTAGKREKGWGVEKKFREGQSEQRLDDLFFHFIDTAKKLKPKIVIAENVTGMLKGAARGYVKEIFKSFDEAGYNTKLFLFDACRMGVPQRRQRVFFIGIRKNLGQINISPEFNETPIIFSKAMKAVDNSSDSGRMLQKHLVLYKYWTKTIPGRSLQDAAGVGSNFNSYRLSNINLAPTITSNGAFLHPTEPRHLSAMEHRRLQTFPDDYWFPKNLAQYICGMSVPPFMMQRIALRIAEQLLIINEKQQTDKNEVIKNQSL
jgi:DNA (cytosine-5)-methyltransferase 1